MLLLNSTSFYSIYYIDMTIIRNHYQMNHYRASSKAQTGAVLLMFLLILVTGASFSLLNQLNAATNLHTRQQATSRALADRRASLFLDPPIESAGLRLTTWSGGPGN